MGGISIIVLIISFFAKYPEANTNYKFSTGFKLLTQPPVFMAALALMCYMGLSNTFNAWLPQIMKEIGASAKQAGLSLSVFGIFVMTGRFIASTFKNLTAWGTKIIGIFAGVLAILIFILSGTHSVIVGLIIAGLAGLAFAPLFPTIVGITFAKYDRKYYGSIFGMIFALGLFFSGVVMKVIGTISSTGTLQSGLLFPVVIAIVMIIVSIILGKVKAKPIE
jgi:fucose permease